MSSLLQSAKLVVAWSVVMFAATSATPGIAEERSGVNRQNSALLIQSEEHNGMVHIPSGTFWMGSYQRSVGSSNDAMPVHRVQISDFWIDKTEVTNEEFQRFVEATNYKTVAEQTPNAEDFPGAPVENLVAGALVFQPPTRPVSKHSHYNWWHYVPGANWRHPEGPTSELTGKWHHPVVQIAWEDANAYAKWAGKRLPTEAEFEYASRGGQESKRFAWGDEFLPHGKWQANIWQGEFPYTNTADDGYRTTAPVASFPPNGFGLYDMAGNVWEWCSDWYHSQYYLDFASGKVVKNPQGPTESFDPNEPKVPKRAQRGGSFLCTDQYCTRYEAGARGRGEPSSGCMNVGFRCAKD